MTSFVINHDSQTNNCLVWCLASQQESNRCDSSRCDSSWYDSNRCNSSQCSFNQFDSNQSDLSLCWCVLNCHDSKFQNFCVQLLFISHYSRAQRFWICCHIQGFHLSLYHTMRRSCWQNLEFPWWGQRGWISPARDPVGLFLWWFPLGSSQCSHCHYAGFFLFTLQNESPDCQGRCPNHCVPVWQWYQFLGLSEWWLGNSLYCPNALRNTKKVVSLPLKIL